MDDISLGVTLWKMDEIEICSDGRLLGPEKVSFNSIGKISELLNL